MVWIGPHQRVQQPLRIGLMNAQRRTTDTQAFLAGRQQGLAILDGQQRRIKGLGRRLCRFGAQLKLMNPRVQRRYASIPRAALGQGPEDSRKRQAHRTRRRRQHQFVRAHCRPGESVTITLGRALIARTYSRRSIGKVFQREWRR